MTAEFGVTAWGRAWLRTIESVSVGAPNPALPQARSLARNGAVGLAEVLAGRIQGKVLAKGREFSVVITVPTWTAAQAGRVRAALEQAGAQDRRIGSGEFPDELVARLQDQDVAVASGVEDCVASCPCTGRRRPCVHHLAAIYCLVQRIDEVPSLAVRLRDLQADAADFDGPGQPAAAEWLPLTALDPDGFYGV
ncbi:hypothetical protein [Tomitella biformata]|uniref:hypothetical protein n=1 Tax=Tomitella biformata TaxID=630403 RepID=UPI000464B1CD|nr:hypothetical protein [Tomitella biformata]